MGGDELGEGRRPGLGAVSVGELAGLQSLDTSQVQIQSFDSACINIYPIDELLEWVNGPVLQIQNYRISTTQGSTRTSKSGPSEEAALPV